MDKKTKSWKTKFREQHYKWNITRLNGEVHKTSERQRREYGSSQVWEGYRKLTNYFMMEERLRYDFLCKKAIEMKLNVIAASQDCPHHTAV